MTKKRLIAAVVLPIAALWCSQSSAQYGAPLSDTDLSKESVNPVSRQITLPLKYEADILDWRRQTH
jgi:hypothetical protein